MYSAVVGLGLATSGRMSTDQLLAEASRELRRFSTARSDAEAYEAFHSLVHCHLPAVGADCPAYGAALTKCLDWLMRERERAAWRARRLAA